MTRVTRIGWAFALASVIPLAPSCDDDSRASSGAEEGYRGAEGDEPEVAGEAARGGASDSGPEGGEAGDEGLGGEGEGASAEAPAVGDPDAEAARRAYDPANLPEGVDDPHVSDAGLSWTDARGRNLLVVVQNRREDAGSGHETARLVVSHWRETSGEWALVRDFREVVHDCSLDLFLSPELGPWSLTDLDDDGVYEATFAWSVACRGDVSPARHKVITTEDGDKSILRGHTSIGLPTKDEPDRRIGGEIEELEGFGDDEARLEHAREVWKKTKEGAF